MALSGVHIASGFIGGFGIQEAGQQLTPHSLFNGTVWSQTMALGGGTTAQGAPASMPLSPVSNVQVNSGQPSFEIYSSIDIYVAVGSAPDATQATSSTTQNARLFVPALTTRNIFCQPGDKLAWIAA